MKGLRVLIPLVCVLAAPQVMAQAAKCEDNFVVNRDNGMVNFHAIQLLDGGSVESLSKEVIQSIERSGFRLDSQETVEKGRVEITFLPNKQSRDMFYAMTATVSSNGDGVPMVGMHTIGDTSLKQQTSPQMKSFMCGFLADLPSAKAMVAKANVTQQANPDRGAAPARQAKVQIRDVRPKAELDIAVAKRALEPGDATITGRACTTNSAGGLTFRDYLRNHPVFLYPVTPYLEEAIGLYEKARKNERVIISPLISEMRIVGQTNSDGDFQFTRVKPGKYLVIAEHESSGAGTYNSYEGSGVHMEGNTQVTTNYYQERDFFASWKDILKDRVTISKPGQVVKISLTPPFRVQGILKDLNRGKQKGTGLTGLSCSEWQFK